jgi:hypothetical protein
MIKLIVGQNEHSHPCQQASANFCIIAYHPSFVKSKVLLFILNLSFNSSALTTQ